MNIVSVTQSGKNYLFSVPDGIQLNKGDRVLCDTIRGEAEGICATDSFTADEHATDQVIALTGAYKPLKAVIAKQEWRRFEKTAEQTPPIREVKRAAKVDEYVRNDRTDEICKVIALDKSGDKWIYVRSKEHSGNLTGLYADRIIDRPFDFLHIVNYTVLENYQEAAK